MGEFASEVLYLYLKGDYLFLVGSVAVLEVQQFALEVEDDVLFLGEELVVVEVAA